MSALKPTLRLVSPGDRPVSPPAADVSPRPPAWMPKEAKAEWRRVMPVLQQRRTLTDADIGLLENYCVAMGQIRQCQAQLKRSSDMFVQSPRSAPRPHPAFRLMHEAMRHARQLGAELGLSPASRGRMNSVDPVDDDDFEGLVDE